MAPKRKKRAGRGQSAAPTSATKAKGKGKGKRKSSGSSESSRDKISSSSSSSSRKKKKQRRSLSVAEELGGVQRVEYSDVHRAFVQRFLAKPMMTDIEAKKVIVEVRNSFGRGEGGETDLALVDTVSFIEAVNERLRPNGFEVLRERMTDVDGKFWLALVNTLGSEDEKTAMQLSGLDEVDVEILRNTISYIIKGDHEHHRGFVPTATFGVIARQAVKKVKRGIRRIDELQKLAERSQNRLIDAQWLDNDEREDCYGLKLSARCYIALKQTLYDFGAGRTPLGDMVIRHTAEQWQQRVGVLPEYKQ